MVFEWNCCLYFNDISELLNNVKESWIQLRIKAPQLRSAWVLSVKIGIRYLNMYSKIVWYFDLNDAAKSKEHNLYWSPANLLLIPGATWAAMIALPPSSLTLTQERNTHHSCYHEESLKEKSQLSSGVLLTLAQVVAVVHQVGVEPNLNVEGVSKLLPTSHQGLCQFPSFSFTLYALGSAFHPEILLPTHNLPQIDPLPQSWWAYYLARRQRCPRWTISQSSGTTHQTKPTEVEFKLHLVNFDPSLLVPIPWELVG